MKPAFLIASPGYSHQSGGVRVLHELCDTLNRLGFEAGIAFLHGGNATEQNFQWAITNLESVYMPDMQRKQWQMEAPDREIAEYLSRAIMIYPDLITGNPLQAPRVVRYLLNRNDSVFVDEYVLCFSRLYADNYNATLFNVFNSSPIHAEQALHWSQRPIDLTYIGKGPNFTETHKIPETIILERAWPSDKDQLGILLRNSRFMFSWDSVSATNLDAVICGCVPVLLHDKQISREELTKGELRSCLSISLEDLHDKNSVIYDRDVIDRQVQEINDAYHYYIDSWDTRVAEFVEHCANYFNMDWSE